MAGFLDKSGHKPTGGNTPVLHGSSALTKLAESAITQRRQLTTTPAPKTARVTGGSTLERLATSSRVIAEHQQKPFLFYLILDLTGSRQATREAMRQYEKQIADLVMKSGGRHPVICKGVYFKGNACSGPQVLTTTSMIESFFNTTPVGGSTCIHSALQYYKNDPVDAILSLAVVIGDTADGDRQKELIDLIRHNPGDTTSRPVVIAYENTGGSDSDAFCSKDGIAHHVATASGGFAYGLTNHPAELINLLKGYNSLLTATPADLREAVRPGSPGAGRIFGQISAESLRFLTAQANHTLLLNGPER